MYLTKIKRERKKEAKKEKKERRKVECRIILKVIFLYFFSKTENCWTTSWWNAVMKATMTDIRAAEKNREFWRDRKLVTNVLDTNGIYIVFTTAKMMKTKKKGLQP